MEVSVIQTRVTYALIALWALAGRPTGAGPWVGANPGAGGAFTAIGAGPTGILLCGSDLGGAYRSLDHGLSWAAIGPARGLNAVHVGAVGFDPQNAGIVYLGSERGVLRSADGGNTFQSVSAPVYIAAVVPAPSNPFIVYAPSHPLYNSTRSGLQKSTDRGLTWSAVSTNLPDSLRITKLIVRPFNPNVLYLVSGSDRFVKNALPSIWKSTDGGSTWSHLAQSLGNAWDLAIDPNNPSNLYATVYAGTPGVSWSGSLWKSTDAGVTWTQKAAHTGCVRVKQDQPLTLWLIDPYRDSASSESGCWQSTDGGDTWSRKSAMTAWDPGWQSLNWAYGSGAYGLAKVIGQDLSNPNALYWADRQFVFASFDGGGTFANLFTRPITPGRWISRGIENVAVTAVAISEADTSRMFTGYYDIGMWRSLDGGASWQSCNPVAFTGAWSGHGGCATSIVPDPVRAGVVFVTLGEKADLATVLKSADAGAATSWIAADGGLPSGFVYGLSMDRTSSSIQRTLFVTSNGDVYKSTNDGTSWSLVLSGRACRVTAVDRFDGSLVYAGGEGGLWRSSSGGAPGSWSQVGPAVFGGSNPETLAEVQWEGVQGITPDPRSRGRVYVAAFGAGRGVFRSNDQGTTWSQLRTGGYCRAVVVDPTHADTLYMTSSRAYRAGGITNGSEGVLRSTNAGQGWLALNDGLPWPFAGPVALNPRNPSKMIVGSPGTGFWIRDLHSVQDTPPVVAATPAASLNEGSPLTLSVTAFDPNGDAITALTAAGLPSGATFTPGAGNTSGTLSWTPTYTQAGSYTVTFTAVNALSGSAATAITVLSLNQPPTASLTVTPSTGNYPLTITADASGSSDADGAIASYRFDFGDGATVGPQASPTASHLYTQGGQWNATVTVTDNQGAARSKSVPIIAAAMQPGPNLCANGSFETNTTGWGAYGGSTLLRVAGGFDGSYGAQVAAPATGTAGFGVNDSPDRIHLTSAASLPYRYTAWVRSPSNTGTCKLQIAEYQGTTRLSSLQSPGVVLSPTWQMLTLDYTTQAAGATLDFQMVDLPKAAGEVFIADDVSIHLLSSTVDVAPVPTGMAPLQPVLSPNPLRSGSTMMFVTARRGPLEVGLYDITGRRVRGLLKDPDAPAGLHRVQVDGRSDRDEPLPSGLYFFRIRAPEGLATGRCVVAR